jgi:lipoprotein signal peptidase
MSTNELSVQVAGAITIALIVGLGIFVYPWLLAQRYGPWVVGFMTILLGALFVVFDRSNSGSGSSTYSLAFAAGWALGPVIAGVIVHRIQRKSR